MTEPNDPRPSLADYHRWIDTAESQGFDSVKVPIDDLRALLELAEADAVAFDADGIALTTDLPAPNEREIYARLNAARKAFRP